MQIRVHGKIPLCGSSFYCINDVLYCETDYWETVEKCDICHEPIADKILKVADKNYHTNCFTCVSCKGHLDGVPFTAHPEEGVHCMVCYRDKFAPRCAACRQSIVPEPGSNETMRVVSLNRSYHIDCYKCEECGLKLSSRIEGHECYPFENQILCRTCSANKRNRFKSSGKTKKAGDT
uniref:LIM zinc-binding domain-containing protein n=1 Tax=Romanomermis culicivorax TaxID=13658 RepID=A0A915KTU8_ROMCU